MCGCESRTNVSLNETRIGFDSTLGRDALHVTCLYRRAISLCAISINSMATRSLKSRNIWVDLLLLVDISENRIGCNLHINTYRASTNAKGSKRWVPLGKCAPPSPPGEPLHLVWVWLDGCGCSAIGQLYCTGPGQLASWSGECWVKFTKTCAVPSLQIFKFKVTPDS